LGAFCAPRGANAMIAAAIASIVFKRRDFMEKLPL
jgi:hypothetical protein